MAMDAMAAAALGHGGEAEERGGGRSRERGRSERGSGRRVASPGRRGGARQAGREEVAGARGLRAPPSSFGVRGRKTTGGEAAVGWAAGGAGPGR